MNKRLAIVHWYGLGVVAIALTVGSEILQWFGAGILFGGVAAMWISDWERGSHD